MEQHGILIDKLVGGNLGTSNTRNIFKKWAKYDPETKQFPKVEANIYFVFKNVDPTIS